MNRRCSSPTFVDSALAGRWAALSFFCTSASRPWYEPPTAPTRKTSRPTTASPTAPRDSRRRTGDGGLVAGSDSATRSIGHSCRSSGAGGPDPRADRVLPAPPLRAAAYSGSVPGVEPALAPPLPDRGRRGPRLAVPVQLHGDGHL